jgi:hypothetical protein
MTKIIYPLFFIAKASREAAELEAGLQIGIDSPPIFSVSDEMRRLSVRRYRKALQACLRPRETSWLTRLFWMTSLISIESVIARDSGKFCSALWHCFWSLPHVMSAKALPQASSCSGWRQGSEPCPRTCWRWCRMARHIRGSSRVLDAAPPGGRVLRLVRHSHASLSGSRHRFRSRPCRPPAAFFRQQRWLAAQAQ